MPRARPIGLISSVPFESRLTLARLTHARRPSPHVTAGRLGSAAVVHVTSGVGAANAAHAATLLILRFAPRALVLFGIGGAYPDSGLENGAVALAEREAYADLGLPGAAGPDACTGMEAVGIPLLTRGNRRFFNEFPLDRTLLGRARKVLGTETPTGLFLTVSSLPESPRRARKLGRRFGAICENMEGAAVAQTGRRYGVPVLEVRGISNRAGERDRSRWLIEPATKNAQQAALDIIPSL